MTAAQILRNPPHVLAASLTYAHGAAGALAVAEAEQARFLAIVADADTMPAPRRRAASLAGSFGTAAAILRAKGGN